MIKIENRVVHITSDGTEFWGEDAEKRAAEHEAESKLLTLIENSGPHFFDRHDARNMMEALQREYDITPKAKP